MNNLSRETNRKLDELVRRVAQKAGYSGGELTYQEHLQMKMEQTRKKLSAKYQRQKYKLGFGSKNNDFVEEIKTYLAESIADYMREGHGEEEALKRTMDQFDEAELRPDFESFMKEFDDFGMDQMEWYAKNGEAIGLFYGGFMFLGIAIGALVGFLSSGGVPSFLQEGWIYTLVGTGVGMFIGMGLGLLSNALIAVLKRK